MTIDDTVPQQIAVITGASKGIGAAFANLLADKGYQLVLVADQAADLAAVAEDIQNRTGERPSTIAMDLSAPDAAQSLLAQLHDRAVLPDLLINNAGIGAMGAFEKASPQRLRDVFEVNFFAVAELIRESLPLLERGNNSMIVNMSSVLGHRGVPLKSEYCASKFALHGFSDAIRAELVEKNIDVLLVSPSTTDSEFFESAIEDTTTKDWKKSGAMPAKKVAAKTIRAIQKGRHEIILTAGGRVLVWLDRMVPGIANRVIAKFGK